MQRRMLMISAALLLASQVLAGDTARESRLISGVNHVVLRGVGDLIFTQSDHESLVVEAEPKLLPKISTEVRSGVLYLDFNENRISTRHPIRFYLSVKDLYRIQSEGSGEIRSGKLHLGYLEIDLRGSGSARIESLSAKHLKVGLVGSGAVRIDGGEVALQEVSIEGSGDYRAPQLTSAKTSVSISGAGNAAVAASEHLTARISGSGEINYIGNAKVESHITGAGSLTRRGS